MRGLFGTAVAAAAACAAMAYPAAASARTQAGEGRDAAPIADWTLLPDYRLPGRAGVEILRLPPQPTPALRTAEVLTPPMSFFGEEPTERRPRLLPEADLAMNSFTIEFMIIDHVNTEVGALAAIRDRATGEPAVLFGYHGKRLFAEVWGEGAYESEVAIDDLPRSGYKWAWRHAVLTHDGQTMRIYYNGVPAGEERTGPVAWPESSRVVGGNGTASGGLDFELAGYMQSEPYMTIDTLLRGVRVWDRALGPDEIAAVVADRTRQIDDGWLVPDELHFMAGPYLHMAMQDSVNITFETDRPTTGRILFGRRGGDLDGELVIESPGRIHVTTLSGLDADAPYFYRVIATDDEGTELDSGLLTFKTAAPSGEPIRFAVMGDPEARPFVNDRIAKLVWKERPDFMLQCGDLTDGGRRERKFEWNHEYFLGLTQLNSRLVVYPVPGNGEGDLYWYAQYHDFPSPDDSEGFYTFTYGDAQFFMLDSNRSATDFRPGGRQYEWLKAELEKSTALWKFAAHHHPVYTSDEDDYGNTFTDGPSTQGDPNVQPIAELYEDYGVDVVFFGHLHSYERTLPMKDGVPVFDSPGGVVYVQAGGAGGNLEDFAPTPTRFSAMTHAGYHYVMVNLIGDRLELRMVTDRGGQLDSYVIEK